MAYSSCFIDLAYAFSCLAV